MKIAFVLLALLVTAPGWAATNTNNDDSCDIALQPAATLLLPYFEVDLKATRAATTLFTLQNVSPAPVIANVTLWTDWGYPVLDFPIHLTGYDVQGINLYDVLALGALSPTECHAGNIAPSLLPELQGAFTIGGTSGCSATVGFFHFRAIGYATIDVVSACSAKNVTASDYFATLLYDNVLTGDFFWVNPGPITGNLAGGVPLVHIRAVPEGGAPGTLADTNLPYTFYDRFALHPLSRKADRRQPLPSVFAPRFINGGEGAFNTTLKIWREGITSGMCSAAVSNSNMDIADAVRFDEHENATIVATCCCILCPPGPPGLPTTSSIPSNNTVSLPPFGTATGDVGGWLYLNLDNHRMTGRASQNWVTATMFAGPTYATEATVPALGNGCSPPLAKGAQIGPMP